MPTSTEATAGTLPQPTHKAVPFAQLTTFQQTIDYALSGYHVASSRADKAEGARGRLWRDAADAYRTAYRTMLPLSTLPADKGFAQAKDLLKNANHLADQAAASAGS